jgi:hypothetical protein
MTLVSAKEEDGAEAEAAASSVTRTSLSIHGPRWLLVPVFGRSPARSGVLGVASGVRRGQGQELSRSWKRRGGGSGLRWTQTMTTLGER